MPTFEERTSIDMLQYLESGQIQVRRATTVFKDGVEMPNTKQYHRHVVAPGDDLTDQDPQVVKMAEAMWTPELIESYKAQQAEIADRMAREMGGAT